MIHLTNTFNFSFAGGAYSKEDILDCYRLQKQLLIEYNMIVTLEEAIDLWEYYSGLLQASWLCFPDKDEEIISDIVNDRYFKRDYNSLYDFFKDNYNFKKTNE